MPAFKPKYAKIEKTAPLQQKGGFLFPNFSYMKNAILCQDWCFDTPLFP